MVSLLSSICTMYFPINNFRSTDVQNRETWTSLCQEASLVPTVALIIVVSYPVFIIRGIVKVVPYTESAKNIPFYQKILMGFWDWVSVVCLLDV